MTNAAFEQSDFIDIFSLESAWLRALGCYPFQPRKEAYWILRKLDYCASDCFKLSKWIEVTEALWPYFIVSPWDPELLKRPVPSSIIALFARDRREIPQKNPRTCVFRRYGKLGKT